MLPADTPLPIRRLLRRCLEKDRKGRLDSAAGARLEIDDAIASPAAETLALAATPSRRVTPVAIAALAGVAVIAALVAWIVMRPAPVSSGAAVALRDRAAARPAAERVRPAIATSPCRPTAGISCTAPEGQRPYGSPLMVRAIDQLDAQPLAGCHRRIRAVLFPR